MGILELESLLEKAKKNLNSNPGDNLEPSQYVIVHILEALLARECTMYQQEMNNSGFCLAAKEDDRAEMYKAAIRFAALVRKEMSEKECRKASVDLITDASQEGIDQADEDREQEGTAEEDNNGV